MVVAATGVKNALECTPYQDYAKHEGLDYDNTLSVLESFFDCSGVCRLSTYRSFSNVAV